MTNFAPESNTASWVWNACRRHSAYKHRHLYNTDLRFTRTFSFIEVIQLLKTIMVHLFAFMITPRDAAFSSESKAIKVISIRTGSEYSIACSAFFREFCLFSAFLFYWTSSSAGINRCVTNWMGRLLLILWILFRPDMTFMVIWAWKVVSTHCNNYLRKNDNYEQ